MGAFRFPSWRASSSVAALLVLVIAASGASGQSPPSIHVSPFVATATSGGLRNIPDATGSAPARSIRFDANFVLGLTAELSWEGVPLQLRAGASRTLGGNLETFSHWESCGTNCSRSVNSAVASAAATTLWADFVFRPYSSRLSPYAFAGMTRRTTNFGDVDSSIAPYFNRADQHSMVRYGVGLELGLVRQSAFWLEIANYRALQSMGPSDSDSALSWPRSTQWTAGLKLRLF